MVVSLVGMRVVVMASCRKSGGSVGVKDCWGSRRPLCYPVRRRMRPPPLQIWWEPICLDWIGRQCLGGGISAGSVWPLVWLHADPSRSPLCCGRARIFIMLRSGLPANEPGALGPPASAGDGRARGLTWSRSTADRIIIRIEQIILFFQKRKE